MPQDYEHLHQSNSLLEESKENESFQESSDLYTDYTRHRWHTGRKLNIVFIFALLLSLAQNAVLFQRNKSLVHKVGMGISKYTGLPTDIPKVYTFRTDYYGENETLSNELWDNINLDASVVALSPEYVKEHKLEKSSPFPWDTERDIYFLKVYHSLHCLKYMRKAFMDLQAGNKSVVPAEHVYHCIDSLRQDVMCKADDTPMPSPRIANAVGDQQVLQCRDLSKVAEWAMAPERSACYRAGNDFRPVVHNLERHAYCPEDSPYYPIANAYFEKHGRKDPWGDDDDNTEA